MYTNTYLSKGYLMLEGRYAHMKQTYDEVIQEHEAFTEKILQEENEVSTETLDEIKTLIQRLISTKKEFENDSLLQAMRVGVPISSQIEFLEEPEADHMPINIFFSESMCKNDEEFEIICQALFTEQQDIETRIEILSNFFGARLDVNVLEEKHPIQQFDVVSIQSAQDYSPYSINYYVTIKGKLKSRYCQQRIFQLKTFIHSLETEGNTLQNYIYKVDDAYFYFKSILKKIEEAKIDAQRKIHQEQ